MDWNAHSDTRTMSSREFNTRHRERARNGLSLYREVADVTIIIGSARLFSVC